MASPHLRLRENWQRLSGHLASVAEQDFAGLFNELLVGTDYVIASRPKDFDNIYICLSVIR